MLAVKGIFTMAYVAPAPYFGHNVFDNGVLEVWIPKPEERKPRRIPIGNGNGKAVLEGTATEK